MSKLPQEVRGHEVSRVFLRLYQDGSFVRSYAIEPGTAHVGRHPDAEIPLTHKRVSREHCLFEFQGQNQILVQDLESANGTFVNGEKIIRRHLAHGDRVSVGPFELRISNPAYKDAEVIPFPNMRTDPSLSLDRFLDEALSPQESGKIEAPSTGDSPSSAFPSEEIDDLLEDFSPIESGVEPSPEVPGEDVEISVPAEPHQFEPEVKIEIPEPPKERPVPRRAPLVEPMARPKKAVNWQVWASGVSVLLFAVLLAYTAFQVMQKGMDLGPLRTVESWVVQKTDQVETWIRNIRQESEAPSGEIAEVQEKAAAPSQGQERRPSSKKDSQALENDRTRGARSTQRSKGRPAPDRRKGQTKPKAKPKKEDSGALFSALSSLDEVTNSDGEENLEALGKNGTGRRTLQARNLKENLIIEKYDVKLPTRKDFQKRLKDEKGRVASKKYNPNTYRKMLGRKIQGIDRCYATHSRSGRGGKISLDFAIRSSGRIENVKLVRSSFKNAKMHACILDLLQGMKVEAPPWDGFEVSYGFRFGARRVTF